MVYSFKWITFSVCFVFMVTISPYYTISDRQVREIEKNSIFVSLFDPLLNSPNSHHKNCIAGSKEN